MWDHLVRAIEEALVPRPPERLGVAVSGGGDSVALLCLATEFANLRGIEVHAVTVDHGLREAAKEEVRMVTDLCGQLGVSHHVEFWQNWNGKGNMMAAARDARYGLISDWAAANDIGAVTVAHTANDQAETLMMRLARGAGVDGLTAMVPRRVHNGVVWLRPLLRVHRRELRYYLQDKGIQWVEDPTNEDRDFERIRMRDALRLLEPLGLTVDTLVDVSYNMSKAREALDWQTFLIARDIARVSHGAVAIDLRKFRTLPEEVARRMFVRALTWVASSSHPPRRAAVRTALEAIREGRTTTLNGCVAEVDDDLIWVCRELKAVMGMSAHIGDIWDSRWTIEGPEYDEVFSVRALGERGLGQVQGWRDIGVPRAALTATPAVWNDDHLVAAPVAGLNQDWTAELEGGNDAFFAAILSH